MPLVVHNQACALRESLLAGNAVWVDEAALEHRFAGVSSALDRDRNLLIGVHRQNFKACVVLPALDGRFFNHHWRSTSTSVALAPNSLVHPLTRQIVRRAHCLHFLSASGLKCDLDALDASFVRHLILFLIMQNCGICEAVCIMRPC